MLFLKKKLLSFTKKKLLVYLLGNYNNNIYRKGQAIKLVLFLVSVQENNFSFFFSSFHINYTLI